MIHTYDDKCFCWMCADDRERRALEQFKAERDEARAALAEVVRDLPGWRQEQLFVKYPWLKD